MELNPKQQAQLLSGFVKMLDTVPTTWKRYLVQSEKPYAALDLFHIPPEGVSRTEAEWIVDYICKGEDGSAENLGIEIVPVEAKR